MISGGVERNRWHQIVNMMGTLVVNELTHFMSAVSFYNPRKHQKTSVFYPILAQCYISIPPENARKLKVFSRFQGYKNGTLG